MLVFRERSKGLTVFFFKLLLHHLHSPDVDFHRPESSRVQKRLHPSEGETSLSNSLYRESDPAVVETNIGSKFLPKWIAILVVRPLAPTPTSLPCRKQEMKTLLENSD